MLLIIISQLVAISVYKHLSVWILLVIIKFLPNTINIKKKALHKLLPVQGKVLSTKKIMYINPGRTLIFFLSSSPLN